jgi:Ca2+-binding EF-hand superfamily protein
MIKLNQSDLENFKKVFDIFDKDGNGSINKQVNF